VSGFFLAKAKTLRKVDFDILTWSLMALRGTLALQSSMATLFYSLEKGLLVFAHVAMIDWQMQSGFLHYIGHQNGNSPSRTMKFCMEHPKTQENKMQLSPGSLLKGESRSSFIAATVFESRKLLELLYIGFEHKLRIIVSSTSVQDLNRAAPATFRTQKEQI
jgi:hypothetical protein